MALLLEACRSIRVVLMISLKNILCSGLLGKYVCGMVQENCRSGQEKTFNSRTGNSSGKLETVVKHWKLVESH